MKVNKSKRKYWKANDGFKLNVPGVSANTMSVLNNPIGSVVGAVASSGGNPYLLAAQLGSQAIKGGVGLYQAFQGQKQLREAEATRPGTSVSEYADIAKRALSSDVLRSQQEQMDKALAASLQSLGQVPGGAGQVSNILEAQQEQQRAAAMQQQAVEMQALGQLAQAKEAELGRREARFQEQAGAAMAAAGAGAENIMGAISGVGGDIGKYQMLQAMRENPNNANAYASLYANAGDSIAEDNTMTKGTFDPSVYYKNEGGMMTKGSFNHKTNPIDIIQEGKKVGEMTGGEVILNPKQQKAVASQSPYFKSLLKKFNKRK